MKVMQVGLGPIGQMISKILITKSGVNIVSAVDINPSLQGQTLGELLHLPNLDTAITNHFDLADLNGDVDVAVVTTSSDANVVTEQIEPLVRRGISVITTCEELSHAWNTQPALANRLDKLAKKHHCAILGTGINPGFLMDFLPSTLTALTDRVDSITVNRIQNARARRLPFQQKIGYGLKIDEFQTLADQGSLRHVGLVESVYYIAEKLNWKLSNVTESIKPIHDDTTALGIKQIAQGTVDDQVKITLCFVAAVDIDKPEDTIIISGSPDIELSFKTPIQGDRATTNVTVNAIPCLLNASPGLKSMSDLTSINAWQ